MTLGMWRPQPNQVCFSEGVRCELGVDQGEEGKEGGDLPQLGQVLFMHIVAVVEGGRFGREGV